MPTDAAEASKGWASNLDRDGQTYRYRLVPPTKDGRCSVEEVRESPLDTACGVATKTVYTWDAERGLPETIRYASTYPDQRSVRGNLKLREVKTHDLAWSRKLAADAERYFAANAAYTRTFSGLNWNGTPVEIEAILEKAKLELKAALQTLEVPEFRQQVDEMLANHDRKAKYFVEEAERRKTILGQPAADWSTTDLAGKAHSLKDYRGKVVILDFWYRSCLFCVQAMPQIKEIAVQFKDQPVIVLGMNTDAKEEDAKLVMEKMGLNYPTLKATGLPEKYKVQSFPTLVIIDQEGIIRDIHVGYSATLKEEVAKSVEGLLKAKKP
jgi:peroxiredoxin